MLFQHLWKFTTPQIEIQKLAENNTLGQNKPVCAAKKIFTNLSVKPMQMGFSEVEHM